MAKKKNKIQTYSKVISGATGNYRWPARFDEIDGYVGINQTSNGELNRVLLSPGQVRALLKFFGK